MTDQSKLTSQLPTVTGAAAGDRVVMLSTSTGSNSTVTMDVAQLLANTAVPHKPTQLYLMDTQGTPANSAALTVGANRIWFDQNYIYVAVANNVVKRAALSSF